MEKLIARISSRLKMLRQTRGWSLDMTSRNTGVSKAMLGQIERGESCPTISVLWKIATGFETAFSTFIDDNDIKNINQSDHKILVTPVFPYDRSLRFETFIIELLPSCEHLSTPHQKGVIEHLVVAQGEIEVLVDGVWNMVRQNEGMHFSADVSHGYRNSTPNNARIIDIIHYP